MTKRNLFAPRDAPEACDRNLENQHSPSTQSPRPPQSKLFRASWLKFKVRTKVPFHASKNFQRTARAAVLVFFPLLLFARFCKNCHLFFYIAIFNSSVLHDARFSSRHICRHSREFHHLYFQHRKKPNNGLEFNKTLGKALLLTALGHSLRFTHTRRKSGLEPQQGTIADARSETTSRCGTLNTSLQYMGNYPFKVQKF